MNDGKGWLRGALLCACLSLSGCAAYMAANQPGQKDFSVFKAGTPRDRVLAEFGSPMHSETLNGQKSDIFTFVQGYNGAVKAGRAVVHGVASLATLGLWEIIGTPVEGHMNGSQLSVRVNYDAGLRVTEVLPLKGDDEVLRNLQGVEVGSAAPQSSPTTAATTTGALQ
ncbi:MAG: hypothetical protein ACT4N2_03200 [Hyphomicrobium sp.]